METNRLKSIINNADSIYIASHMNPDGDNIGSITAMYLALKKYGKNVFLIEDDDVPEAERFLPGISDMVKSETLSENPDLFITLDCADLDRIGNAKSLFMSAKNTLNIDHHSTNTGFADINIIDDKSPATGETLFQVLKELEIEIDKDIATCIYTAISSDTGSFKYDSVRKSTFDIASELMDYNIDINEVAVNLYQNRSLAKTKLLMKAMNSLELYENNKIALAVISDSDIEECGAEKSDSDGIVEFIRDIATVELAVLLKDKGSSVRLSTRSKKYINCTNIASKFGGGGHIRAAGASIDLDINSAKKEVLKFAIEEFRE